jgi:uncharacterized protein YhfF
MTLPEKYKNAPAYPFGDSPELADQLLALIVSGKKTATCGALRDYGEGEGLEPMPYPGRQDVVLDGQGRPACVIENVSVTIRRFDEVDEDFAVAEGEGSAADWRRFHEAFFERNGGWAPDMELVCERFKLVEVFPRDDA